MPLKEVGVEDESRSALVPDFPVQLKTSQELRMLSSVTLDCQVTKIVMNLGSQL